MPITLITGPANAGKAHVVIDALRRHLAHGEEPLLVLPTLVDAERYRRELAADGAVMGARFERFEGLIGEVVRRAGVAEPVLGGLARRQLLASIAAGHGAQPGVRHERPRTAPATASRPSQGVPPARGFVRALAALFAEVRIRRITPQRLAAALRQWTAVDGSESPGEPLGELFGRYARVLEGIGRVDEEQRAVRALDALRLRPALWRGTPVLFYGFDDLTPLQIDAIETLGAVVGAEVTVSLSYEPGRAAFAGRAGSFHALEPLAARHTELAARAEYYAPGARAALAHLERSLFEPDAGRVDPGSAVRLLEGADQRAELELIAREVGSLLERGMAAGEIAVVLRAPGAVCELVEEVFSSAHIPYALQRRRPFADSAIGGAVIGLLRCVPGPDGLAPGDAGDLLAWLRAPGYLEHPELADRLEARAKRTGAHGASQARGLWEQSHWRLKVIDELATGAVSGGSATVSPPAGRPAASSAALIDRVTRELRWLFCAPRRGRASVLESVELDEARALEAGLRALGELRELARLAPQLAPGDAAQLATLLERVEVVSGERAPSQTVAILDPLALRARRVRALFLCGLQDGVFPAPAPAQPLLGQQERRRLAEVTGLTVGWGTGDPRNDDALAAERYLLYAAVSRPEESLTLSWHAADDDGVPLARSPFVDDVCDLFDEGLGDRTSLAGPADRCSGAADGAGSRSARREAVARPGGVARPVGALRTLRHTELLENRAGPDGAKPGHVWSASSLEQWIRCPARWFVERVLRAEDLDPEPEPFARGGLAHAALKDTLEGLRRRTGSGRLTVASLGLARELLASALAENEPDYPLSVAPERRPGVRRRLRADLERYLEHAARAAPDDGHGAPALEPTHLELEFGLAAPADGVLPAFDIGGGVMLRGRIDRVDVSPEGEAVVYDYKGSSAPAAARWIAEGSLQVALYMRVVEGLLGLRAVGGFYQPLTGGDLRPRGVLDRDSAVEVECVEIDRREHAQARALLEEATALALEAAAQAGRGEIEARPRTCAFRGGCSHPAICRCEP